MCGLWEQACGLKENITACVTANPGDGDSRLQARCEPLAGAGRNLTSRRVCGRREDPPRRATGLTSLRG